MKHHPNQSAERFRLRVDGDSWAVGTNNGVFTVPSPEGPFKMNVIASCGGGWDHVSVSFKNRTPTWKEMCAVKDLFFKDDEVAMQLHPPKDDYVNEHQFCLHLWRPQTFQERELLTAELGDDSPEWPTPMPIPLPPAIAVGLKMGVS